jgi:DNA invertase Pin-like site-specific DNA recombinase
VSRPHIGYARVSTGDQNPDLQLAALKAAGCVRVFTDTATGAHVRRPELTRCLKALGEGDILTVWKLDRLGRSLRDLIGLLDDLKARGVAFRSLTEALDTMTPIGRAMWQMVGILAELERGPQAPAIPSTGRRVGTGVGVADSLRASPDRCLPSR